jgi:hypothetical protein
MADGVEPFEPAPALCPDECDCEVAYCSDCLRAAAERNAEAGVAYTTHGARLMLDSSPSQWPAR